MSDPQADLLSALDAFVKVAGLAGIPIQAEDVVVEWLAAPHTPPKQLPRGFTAVYCFWGDGAWLKIGHVGAQSGPRYTSQHYNPKSAPSTFAASLLRCTDFLSRNPVDDSAVGEWIRANCIRANLLIDNKQPRELRFLLEAFLHARFRPRYER